MTLGLCRGIFINKFRSRLILKEPQRILSNLDNVNIDLRHKKGKKKVQDICENIVNTKDLTPEQEKAIKYLSPLKVDKLAILDKK